MKRAPLTREQREDDHLVEKRARLNKEKQLKRPTEESCLNAEGAIVVGEKNNMIVQHPHVQLGLQNQNGSTLEFGGAFKSFVTEYLQLIEQKKQQEAQIKELKEALDRAKTEIREETEARVAAEQKVRSLTEERNALQNEKLGSDDEAKRWDEKKWSKWMAKIASYETSKGLQRLAKKTCPDLPKLKSFYFNFPSLEAFRSFTSIEFVHLKSLEYLQSQQVRVCREESDCRMLTSAHVQQSFSRTLFDDFCRTDVTAKDGKERNNLPLPERRPSPVANWHEFSYLDLRWPSPTNEWNEHSLMNLRWPSPIKEWNEYPLVDQDFDMDNNEEMF